MLSSFIFCRAGDISMMLMERCEQGHLAGKMDKLIANDATIVVGWMDGWVNGMMCLQPLFSAGEGV